MRKPSPGNVMVPTMMPAQPVATRDPDHAARTVAQTKHDIAHPKPQLRSEVATVSQPGDQRTLGRHQHDLRGDGVERGQGGRKIFDHQAPDQQRPPESESAAPLAPSARLPVAPGCRHRCPAAGPVRGQPCDTRRDRARPSVRRR